MVIFLEKLPHGARRLKYPPAIGTTMTREMGKLYVGIDCTNCGVHGEGRPTDGGRARCGKCGRFGSEASEYCVEHDVHYAGLYPEDNHCPMCREERHIQEMHQHEVTRDPQVEPW